MKSETPRSGFSPIFHLTIGFVIGAIVVGSSWLATQDTASPPNNVVHDVTVSYMYETEPGNVAGNNDQAVGSIQFHPGYVVITGTTGSSRLLAVDRLRNLKFSPTDTK